jgi:hypothetical protein
VLKELDGWLRPRLRGLLWRQWKRPATRARKLRTLGLDAERARLSAGNGPVVWKGGERKLTPYPMVCESLGCGAAPATKMPKMPAEVKLKAGMTALTLEVAPRARPFRGRVCAMGPWPVRRQGELFVRRN